MKLIIQNDRIAATATDDYTGPDIFVAAPEDFDILRAGEYRVVDGAAAIPPVDFGKEQAAFILKIDADADAIYAKALGNRATEYAQAEADATAYKAAGYTGTVPGYIQAWATATGKTATWATDDILATSTAWRTAMSAIRFNRLGCKESARNAADLITLNAVKDKWDGFVTAITSQLGA